MKHAIAFAVVALFAVACSKHKTPPKPTSVPADFSVEFSSGPVRASMGGAESLRLAPDKAGGWTLKKVLGPSGRNPDGPETIESSQKLTSAQVLPLYQQVVVQRFFDLDNSYSDPDVRDGGRSGMNVRANGKTKYVSVSNVKQKRYSAVANALHDLVKR